MAVVKRFMRGTDGKGRIIYQVRVRDPNGRWYPSRVFDRRSDASAHERALKRKADKGIQRHYAQASNITLAEYWKCWARECRSDISAGWEKTQDQMWRDYVKPKLGSLRMADIGPQDVRKLLADMKTKLARGPQTRLHVYNFLHKIFEDACDEEPPVINTNPVRKKFRPKVIHKERNHLAPAESLKLLEASRDDWLGPAVWIGILVGLRPEAVQPLRVRFVDFVKKEILICECLKRRTNRIEPYPKGKEWERVPIPDQLVAYLRGKLEGKGPDDFVVTGLRGPMVSYNSFRRNLARLCRKAGVEVITPHELRHSTSEIWVEMGATEEDIKRLLSHKDSRTTRRYMHRSDRRLRELAQSVGTRFGQDRAEEMPNNVVQLSFSGKKF